MSDDLKHLAAFEAALYPMFGDVEYREYEMSLEADGRAIEMFRSIGNTITNTFASFTQSRDYTAIILTKGDITKVHNIQSTIKCIDYLIGSKNKEVNTNAGFLKSLYGVLIREKNTLKKEMQAKNDTIEKCYYQLVRTIITGTSALISFDLGEVKKAPGICKYIKISYDAYVTNNGIKAIIDDGNHKSGAVSEAIVIPVIIFGASLAVAALYATKLMLFYFYHQRVALSDYFAQQAAYLELHANEVQNNNKFTAAEKEAILAKQRKWGEVLMKLSEIIAVDDIKSTRSADDDNNEDNKNLARTVSPKKPENTEPTPDSGDII